ncbi:MAG TPA: hypothetical protein VGB00_11935, partial [Pyrinomonadaceae bacterium]
LPVLQKFAFCPTHLPEIAGNLLFRNSREIFHAPIIRYKSKSDCSLMKQSPSAAANIAPF